MNSYVILLIVVVSALVGYFLPKKYDEYFYHKYYENALSTPLSVASAVAIVLWLVFMDSEGFWYWALLIGAILLCLASIIYVIYIGLDVRASTFEIVFAVVAQLLSIVGVVILLLGVIMLISEIFGKKKKRR